MQRVIFGLVLLILIKSHVVFSQDIAPIDTTKIDTSYYVQYPTKLLVGYFQSLQNYVIRIKPDLGIASTPFHEYSSGSRTISGIEVGYDKLFLAANFRTVKNDVYRRGNNKVFNFAFKAGSNKLQFEGLVQRSKGFFDYNSPNYNPVYAKPDPYYRNDALQVNLLRFKVTHFVNHRKFAVKSILGHNFRQHKSSFSPVVSIGFYKTRLYSADGIINPEIRPFYGSKSSIYEFRAVSALVGAGLGGTFVFYKNLFLSGVGIISLDPQLRHYQYSGLPDLDAFKLSFGTDVLLVLGYNSEDFYAGLWLNNSHKSFDGNSFKIDSDLSNVGFSFAYRINIKKEPAWVQRIKANKIYRSL